MLERLDEGELVRVEDGGWLEELEVVHIMGLGEVHHTAWRRQSSGWCCSSKKRGVFALMALPGECRPERRGVTLREGGVETREAVQTRTLEEGCMWRMGERWGS